MQEFDVAIVGGGPIGGYIAKKIAENNYKVAIFEKNKEIGKPINCAGLVSKRVFDFFDFSTKNIIQNSVKGANIHSPSDDILSIGGDKVHAYVIDRTEFDKQIIKTATDNGAEIFLKNNVLAAQKTGDYIELKTSQNIDIRCKLLIGADGPYSKIRDRFVFPKPSEFLRGIGAEIKNINLNPDFVEIFVGKNIAPGFFAWMIPTNKDGSQARIGLCINQNSPHPPKYYLSNLFKNSSLLKDATTIKYIAGIVPLGSIKRSYSSNVLVVGDAAAQVKPTSGGGIYTGLLCADHCSNVSIDALENNTFSSKFLRKYHKLWTADIGKELSLGMKFRKIYKKLTDKQMDKYLKRFQNPKITETISKYGDIDYPSKLIKPLLKKTPSLLKLLPSVIKEK
jgi:geranylgeranyl reductase family protein